MDIDKVTDAQAIEIMLTLPWTMGDLNDDGEAAYSEDEIQTVIGYVRKIAARAREAEARNDHLANLLNILSSAISAGIEIDGVEVACRPDIKAEVERLRDENESLREQLDEAIAP